MTIVPPCLLATALYARMPNVGPLRARTPRRHSVTHGHAWDAPNRSSWSFVVALFSSNIGKSIPACVSVCVLPAWLPGLCSSLQTLLLHFHFSACLSVLSVSVTVCRTRGINDGAQSPHKRMCIFCFWYLHCETNTSSPGLANVTVQASIVRSRQRPRRH